MPEGRVTAFITMSNSDGAGQAITSDVCDAWDAVEEVRYKIGEVLHSGQVVVVGEGYVFERYPAEPCYTPMPCEMSAHMSHLIEVVRDLSTVLRDTAALDPYRAYFGSVLARACFALFRE